MSFMVSDALKDRLNEKTFLSDQTVTESYKLSKQNLKKIKFFSDNSVQITFSCNENVLGLFLQEKILTIKFINLCFKKLNLKQIVIEDNKCILKIFCREKEIENN